MAFDLKRVLKVMLFASNGPLSLKENLTVGDGFAIIGVLFEMAGGLLMLALVFQ